MNLVLTQEQLNEANGETKGWVPTSMKCLFILSRQSWSLNLISRLNVHTHSLGMIMCILHKSWLRQTWAEMNPVSSNKTCHVCVRYLQLGHISLHCKHCKHCKHCLLCLNGYTHDISYVCLTHICIVCAIIGASMKSTTLGELNGGFFIYICIDIIICCISLPKCKLPHF